MERTLRKAPIAMAQSRRFESTYSAQFHWHHSLTHRILWIKEMEYLLKSLRLTTTENHLSQTKVMEQSYYLSPISQSIFKTMSMWRLPLWLDSPGRMVLYLAEPLSLITGSCGISQLQPMRLLTKVFCRRSIKQKLLWYLVLSIPSEYRLETLWDIHCHQMS
jgi:hypothetical protein